MPKTIPFLSKGEKKDSKDGEILDHGTIGDLHYEIYARNVIHIFNDVAMFHKDITAFETEISNLDFSEMKEGNQVIVKGAGDTDNLIFIYENGELKIKLNRKGFDVVEKLKAVLQKNKK